MLYIVSKMLLASALTQGVELPVPAPGTLDALVELRAAPAAEDQLAGAPASERPGADTGTGGHPELGRTAAQERLAESRGGTGIASDTRLGGEVANNTAQQIHTGANRIESGSFSASVGLPVVIQNSGANVLIQNATVINLQFK